MMAGGTVTCKRSVLSASRQVGLKTIETEKRETGYDYGYTRTLGRAA